MPEQSYANHAHRPTAWLVTSFLALAAALTLAWGVVEDVSLQTIALVVLAVAVVMTVMLVRQFALRLQDRIIRLEMQVRLARLGRSEEAARLSLRQIIALRFASDAELAALVTRALTENMSADEIKRAVTQWQADELRT